MWRCIKSIMDNDILSDSESYPSISFDSISFDTESDDQLYIYILKLEKDKYYVGSTINVHKRFKQHMNGSGSAWTKKYKPIEVLESFPGDCFDEDKTLKVYMSKFGIGNVRGGSYSNLKLTKNQLICLMAEIKGADNICWRCGSDKHLSSYCKTGKRKVVNKEKVKYVKKRNCSRCGRSSHNIKRCNAKTHFDGSDL